jgi:hypothetical protein
MVRATLQVADSRLKFMRRLLAISILLSWSAYGQDVAITAKADSTNYRIGDWIHVRVEAKVPPNVESIVPTVKDSIGSFEILKLVSSQSEGHVWHFTLTTFDSGKAYLPPIEFAYRVQGDTATRVARSNSQIFDITSVAVDPQGEIRDIKPPMNAPWLFEDYLPYVIALVIVLLAGFGYYYWRKKQREKERTFETVKPSIPPHQQALFALRELEEKKLWQQGKVKEYYSEATEIIRRFFEGRWNIIALELTSDEILQQMKTIPEAQNVWREMQQFFMTADLVKFAKYQPTPDEHVQELQWAYQIVRSMEPKTETARQEVEYAG